MCIRDSFAIMDGTTAGNGPGPRTMYPVVKNVMLASADQVAILSLIHISEPTRH